MMTTRWLRAATGFAALAMFAAACGSSSGGSGAGGGGSSPALIGDGTLKIGYLLPETGQLAFLGPPQIDGVKYAIQQINAAGGVLGKSIPAPVGGDEAGDTAVAQQSADQLLASNVQAIVGAAASGMTLSVIDKITGAHVMECSASNTAPTFTNYPDHGYYFRTAPSDALQGPVLANTVVADGHSKVAIVARADDYGKGLANATAKALQQSGASVVLNETYDPTTTNFAATVQKVAAAKPDAVVIIAFEEGAQILKGLIEAGYGPSKVGVYGADGLNSPQLGKLVDPANPAVVAGMKGTAPTSSDNAAFDAALKTFDPKLQALQYGPQAFDCTNVIALAAQMAKTNDPSVFKKDIAAVTNGANKCSTYAECKSLLAEGKTIAYQGASGALDLVSAGPAGTATVEPGSAMIQVYGFDKKGVWHSLKTVVSKPAS